ncbi:MAG: polyprenol monophosphomannose synthase [Chloroflexi bacterium]|nr:polyprenol monophosphomannose synthase [Chloroflexota bacterium]
MPQLSLIVPTYNERENVGPLFRRVASVISDFEIIFVDDNSPDGTAAAIKELQSRDNRVKLLQRPGKLGLGTAVLDGMKQAEGEFVGMMDADLSHDAETLPDMIAAFSNADIIIGSRYVKGGKILGWPLSRHMASRVAILIARVLVGVPVKDTTSGYVMYRRELMEGLRGKLSTRGYKLLLEVLARSPRARVKEVPIIFINRLRGQSKLNQGEVKEFLKLCWRFRRYRRERVSG